MKTSKKVLSIVLSVAMILSAMVLNISAADFDETWTAITNATELKAIENDMAGKYYLANDITLNGDFQAIGWLDSGDTAFTGTFDGNGKTVSGLTIASGSNNGLFAINGGTIKNLTVKDASVTVSTQGGIIAGVNNKDGVISNCTVSDSIVAGTFYSEYSISYRYWLNYGYQVGGIVGLNKGTVYQCVNNNTDVRGWLEVGGIVGCNTGKVSQCVSSGDINSTNSGVASNAQVNRFSWAAQSAYVWYGECAYGRAGGLCGYNAGEISDVIVGGSANNQLVDIAGWNSVGGVCGKNEGSMKNAYSVSTKFTIPNHGATFTFPSDSSYSGTYTWTDDVYIHPMTASQEKGTTENCFYSKIVNGSIPAQATKDGKRGNEKTSEEMKSGSDMYKEAGWDFDNVWSIDSDSKLPILKFLACKHENTEVIGKKDPTCGEPGYTGDTVCKDCGETISKGEVIPATGNHTWDEGKVTKEPSCKEEGEKTYTCTVCGATKTEVLPKTDNHVWDEGKVTKEPSCKEEGEKTYTCTVCGATKTEVLPKTDNHVWDEGKVTKEPSCKEEGEKTYTCTVCGATKTEVLPKTDNHVWDEGKVTKEPSCKEEGEKTYTCTVCGATKTEVLPKTDNHVWNDGEVTKEPSCTEAGEKTFTCTVCGATKSETIPATGHDYEVVGKKEATCEEDGYTGDEVCKNCGDVKSTGSVIPAKGHNDANGDGKCDNCGKDIGGGNSGDDHGNNSGSHKGFSGLMNWFTRLMILIRHLLGMATKQ